MNAEALTSISTTIGGGFIGGLLLGYALKKVVKLTAVVVGLFLAGTSVSPVSANSLLRLG
jgi:uncharacterized membrane protein (Fun14 family)